MKIENSFTIDAPVEQAWTMLTDIPGIAPCLPGAKLTDEKDGVYSGSVKIKVGPVTAEYRGSAEFIERDDENHRAVIDGKGRDSRGAGNAQALITAEMHDEGNDQTRVDISTDLKITGKVAQFGRGVMQDVSEKLLGQFADCLETKFEGTAALEDIAAASAEADADADAADAPTATAASAVASTADTGSVAAVAEDDDDEALDLLDVAGGAVFKRLIPMALLALIIVVVLILVFA
jgi:carbon monoxide dehydrogenase subunit G